MGYNTWNDLGCADMSEANVKAAADALVSTGLRDVGYVYVNLDDCWHAPKRDAATGRLLPHADRFPSGMKALGDYLHSRGLRFGIYTDRGSLTCAGRPGSLGHEALDAQTFAEWGVDYVKEDNCFARGGPDNKDELFSQFSLFRDALNRTGRPMFFSVCGGGDNFIFSNLSYYASDPRGGAKLANAWRVTSDCINWSTCSFSGRVAAGLATAAGPGGINDADMLLGSSARCARWLSPARSRTQFSLWAVLMSPLLLGARVSQLTAFDLETYRNTRVVAVSQDPAGHQGWELARGSLYRSVYGRPLSGGDFALVFVNGFFLARDVVCDAACWHATGLPSGAKFAVEDLWQTGDAVPLQATVGQSLSVRVPAWGASVMVRLVFRPTALVV